MDKQLQIQKEQLKKEPKLEIVASCIEGNGILRLNEEFVKELLEFPFSSNSGFFIPASGMGSRMFGFLFQFLVDGIETNEIKQFFRKLESFPFFHELKTRLGKSYSNLSQKEIVAFLLSKEGMDLAEQPKGMIPFHKYGNDALVPFEEHLMQVIELQGFPKKVHYTVQEEFLSAINSKIKARVDDQIVVTYSFQDPTTDAFCFDENGQPVIIEGSYLRRPAGHGALLQNLNSLPEEVIFLKNIDNIQPVGKSEESLKQWSVLNGLLQMFKSDLVALRDKFSEDDLKRFNAKYQLFQTSDLPKVDSEVIKTLCDRPCRVCGMVINEGAPGGGPFWVKEDGFATKQIVEKVQIGNSENDKKALSESTHFNPVFIVVDKRTPNRTLCDLNDFVDPDTFIRVEKDQKGLKVIYHELPGLWNGSMASWNTLFVEIPKSVFTPVKTVLDLVGKDHLS